MFVATLILVFGATSNASSSATAGGDPKDLCSAESQKHLSSLTLKGETRFSEFRYDPTSAQVTAAEFTDLGATGHGRHRKKKKEEAPATPQFGEMLVMNAQAKEQSGGWRNLVLHCGVHKGKIATFTYEIMSMADGSAAPPKAAATTAAAAPAATTPATAPVANQNP